MPTIFYNDGWMLYNSCLALVAVALGFAIFFLRNRWLKIVTGFFWLLFLPNTIYIFTDLEHLLAQWNTVPLTLHLLLLIQYLLFEIVGFITYLLAFLPFEKIVRSVKELKTRRVPFLIVCNFFIAFGMVLGRVERINSWEVITDPSKVAQSAMNVLSSLDLLSLTILFGLFCNFVYFLFRNRFIRIVKGLFQNGLTNRV
jgi:uncharacterized membrane protein